jgi:3-phenylpropionate/trans-cinnamate dioxygenase ferredoxin subunit
MRWQPIAALADALKANPWLAVDVEGAPVVIAAVEGEWFAVADACTHAGCPFSEEADLEDGVIICNCHGSEFELRTGAVIRGPAERPVRTYPLRVNGDGLEIEA